MTTETIYNPNKHIRAKFSKNKISLDFKQNQYLKKSHQKKAYSMDIIREIKSTTNKSQKINKKLFFLTKMSKIKMLKFQEKIKTNINNNQKFVKINKEMKKRSNKTKKR